MELHLFSSGLWFLVNNNNNNNSPPRENRLTSYQIGYLHLGKKKKHEYFLNIVRREKET